MKAMRDGVILDVAGGRGDLAFELVNIDGQNVTVVDPRALNLARFVRRALGGFFHRTRLYDPALLPGRADAAAYGYAWRPPASVDDVRLPSSLRLFFEPYLWTSPKPALDADELTDADDFEQPTYESVLAQQIARAAATTMTVKGLETKMNDDEEGDGDGDGDDDGVDGGEREDEDDDNDDDDDDAADGVAALEASTPAGALAVGGNARRLNHLVCECGVVTNSVENLEAHRRGRRHRELMAGGGVASEAVWAPDVTSAPAAATRDLLERAALLIGCHPDQATEWIVDAALALDKPFAVMPCCVFARDFMWRRLPSGDLVGSYEQLLEYLQAKAPDRIHRTTLSELDGRNVVLYCLGSAGRHSGRGDGDGDGASATPSSST